jgi:hypothetical protein
VAIAAETLLLEGMDALRRGTAPVSAWTDRMTSGYGPRRPAPLAALQARCAAEAVVFDACGCDQSLAAWHYQGPIGVRLYPDPDWTRVDLGVALVRMGAAAQHGAEGGGSADSVRVLLVVTRFARGPTVERVDALLDSDPALLWRAHDDGYDAWLLQADRPQ